MRTLTVILSSVMILASTAAPAHALTTTAETQPADQQADLMPQVDPTTAPPARSSQPAANPVVLRVNGEPIRAFEISMIMQTIQSQLQQRGEEVNTSELAQVATQRAIEQKLLAQEARRRGLEPDELEVARAVQTAEQQAGGRPALESKLEASGASYDQLLGVIGEIELVRMLIEQRIQPEVEVDDQEIASFYEDNPELFEAGERVHAFHMIFIVSEDAPEAEQAAALAKAEAARKRALTGVEDFTAIARDLSEGPSAPNGGDLGWVPRDGLVEPLAKAVFELEPGEISDIVRSKFGYHVATISERRPAETISLEAASEQIVAALRRQKATDAVTGLLESLVAAATVENLLGAPTSAQATD